MTPGDQARLAELVRVAEESDTATAGAQDSVPRPAAYAEDLTLVADSIEVLSPGQVLQVVTAVGTARAVAARADSLDEDTPEVARTDWMEGDTIVANFVPPGSRPDGETGPRAAGRSLLETLVSVGNARSLYRVPPDTTLATAEDEQPTGLPPLHWTQGQRITMYLTDGQVVRMFVEGETLGYHFEPRPPVPADSAAVADSSALADSIAVPALPTARPRRRRPPPTRCEPLPEGGGHDVRQRRPLPSRRRRRGSVRAPARGARAARDPPAGRPAHEGLPQARGRLEGGHPGPAAEIVGLLGPNGAGKTTTFYMLVGLISPDAGKVFLDDAELTPVPMYKRARMGVGYLAQEPSVFRRLTVAQNVMAILETLNIPRRERATRLEELLAELSIGHLRDAKAYSLSGGERRRVEITRALVQRPKFMLLDEPFAGIDPIAVSDIQEIVTQLRTREIGVIISDHNVEQTLEIVDRAYIMYEGRIRVSGTVPELVWNDDVADLYLGPSLTARMRQRFSPPTA